MSLFMKTVGYCIAASCSCYTSSAQKPPELILTSTTIAPTAIKNAAEDVVVKTGTTLTVQGTLNMAKGHKIIVEAGATLLVDGGTITLLSEGVVTLYDIYGRMVGSYAIQKGAVEVIVPTQDLISGIYTCKLTVNNATAFVTKLSVLK